MVLGVDEHFPRLEAMAFVFFKFCVRGDDNEVASVYFASGGSVETNLARISENDVSVEALSVIDVVDLDSFVRKESGRVAECRINGDGTFVVEVGSRDSGSVDLTFHQGTAHARGVSTGFPSLASSRFSGS